MNELIGDLFSLCGLVLTLIGAGIAANAVILREDDAIAVGVCRWSGETREEDLALPMVQNLLKASRSAMWGLILVAAGTSLQIVPIVLRLVQ